MITPIFQPRNSLKTFFFYCLQKATIQLISLQVCSTHRSMSTSMSMLSVTTSKAIKRFSIEGKCLWTYDSNFFSSFPKVSSVFFKPIDDNQALRSFLHLSCTQCSRKILLSTATERSALSFLQVYQNHSLLNYLAGFHGLQWFTALQTHRNFIRDMDILTASFWSIIM